MQSLKFLSGNAVKILAATFMLLDHIGYLLLPQYPVFRILGRLSLPLFAFMLAEGCRYTKNKVKHFLVLFCFAFACQLFYFIYDGSLDMSILVTFCFSVLNIYALQFFKKSIFSIKNTAFEKCICLLPFAGMVTITYIFCDYFWVDYGFWGCMLPVFVSIFDFKDIPMPENIAKFDNLYTKLLCLAAGLLLLAINLRWDIQYYSFFALILLFFYNGKRGKGRMKYFFYLFYPLHLALLEGVSLFL